MQGSELGERGAEAQHQVLQGFAPGLQLIIAQLDRRFVVDIHRLDQRLGRIDLGFFGSLGGWNNAA